jgi:hypothetical protein
LTTGPEKKINELRKGRAPLLERGHTIVLGWSDQVFTVAAELAAANRSTCRSSVVILLRTQLAENKPLHAVFTTLFDPTGPRSTSNRPRTTWRGQAVRRRQRRRGGRELTGRSPFRWQCNRGYIGSEPRWGDAMGSVAFVCLHGANKSRLAAALFNRVAPPGWHAVSAGLEPQAAVSVHALRLIAGTGAELLLDRDPPRELNTGTAWTQVVAIDCTVPGAARWDLACQDVDAAMVDELRERAEHLAAELTGHRS